MAKQATRITVNGKSHARVVEARLTLADFLRHELGLTGTHLGCEHGVCGACTVLVDGRSARSCLMFAVQANGCEVTTVEGLTPDGELSVLQQAFMDNHGLQCGFCTPGMLITLTELLRDNADPSEAEVREALTGNLCRCTGYAGIVKAALDAAQRLRGNPPPQAGQESELSDGRKTFRRAREAAGGPGAALRPRPLRRRSETARPAARLLRALAACSCHGPRHRHRRRHGDAGHPCGAHRRRSARADAPDADPDAHCPIRRSPRRARKRRWRATKSVMSASPSPW